MEDIKESQENKSTETVEHPEKGYFEDFIGPAYRTKSYKQQKYIALYKARYLLNKIGSMQERNICGKKLKTMQKKGLKTV